MVEFIPHDRLRYGYRLWVEREAGVLLKIHTLGADGKVLEQAAFSELDVNTTVRADPLIRRMAVTAGYQLTVPHVVKTTVEQAGWALRQPVAGFVPVSCRKRTVFDPNPTHGMLRC